MLPVGRKQEIVFGKRQTQYAAQKSNRCTRPKSIQRTQKNDRKPLFHWLAAIIAGKT
jgi:hypothetical protein